MTAATRPDPRAFRERLLARLTALMRSPPGSEEWGACLTGEAGSGAWRVFCGRLPACDAACDSKSAVLRREARLTGGLGSGMWTKFSQR